MREIGSYGDLTSLRIGGHQPTRGVRGDPPNCGSGVKPAVVQNASGANLVEGYTARLGGGLVSLVAPAPGAITAHEIAYTLAVVPRFGGRTVLMYPVALHCLCVADLVHERTGDKLLAAAGLLHDAHEAYVGDVTSPHKRLLAAEAGGVDVVGIVEARLDRAIGEAFGIDPALFKSRAVRDADRDAVHAEALALGVEPEDPAARAWVPADAARLPLVDAYVEMAGDYAQCTGAQARERIASEYERRLRFYLGGPPAGSVSLPLMQEAA